jgi:hypothetical protein
MMPTNSTPNRLADRIQSLLTERRSLEQQINSIDQTLSQIERLLGQRGGGGARRGRPPGSGSQAMSAAIGQSQGGRRRRRRGKFATSGVESIINFVRSRRNPTTRDINQHWKSEGRGGTADNTLTLLTKNRQLKRIAAGEGERGSRYQVA